MTWETVIGIEVHTQLATLSKIFSGAATTYGAAPNTQACAVDLALPGTLPVLNRQAVAAAIQFGLAIGATINKRSVFARKNYFYPDLPKGYQISQYDLPIVGQGHLDIIFKEGHTKTIGITRAHLEEDAGKSLHEDFHGQSAIDLNRAGIPLLEIVSEPDMRSKEEAILYLKTLHALLRHLGISDGNMQEGSFRCDVNISVRPMGRTILGTRTELKNLNSFKFVEKAIDYEAARQIAIIEQGGSIKQETRLYDAVKDETRSLRSKEDAQDYRYFPDPDLLPLVIEDDWLKQLQESLPELPRAQANRFQSQYGLSRYDADVLVSDKQLAAYFEEVTRLSTEPKLAANWIMGDLSALLNEHNLDIAACPIPAATLAQLIQRLKDGTISGRIAKELILPLWHQEASVDELIDKKGLKQISDSTALEGIIISVLAQHPSQVAEYKAGKEKLFGFLVGQVMKASQGKANPDEVNRLLKAKL